MKDFIEKKFGRKIALPSNSVADSVDKMPKIAAGQWLVYQVDKSNLLEILTELKGNYDFQFNFLTDITAVDWGDTSESYRFKVIYQLLSTKYNQRLTIKTCLSAEDLQLDSVSSLWRSAICMEREVWDMFGIHFKGHPDLRRILLYDEFQGYPLRKDYPIDKKQPRKLDEALRSSAMVLNMGPSHPATHGTARLMLELDDEVVQRCDAEIGYSHRGFEKQCENVNYAQIVPYTDRLNYTSPIINNVGYCLAIERLLEIETPMRCQHIRVIMSELSRIGGHLACLSAISTGLGAETIAQYLIQAGEYIYELMEMTTGARVTCSYSVIGGVSADLPDNFKTEVLERFKKIKKLVANSNKLLLRNRIFIDRLENVGIISKKEAIDYGLTGPALRASGLSYDVRKQLPYLTYSKYNFEIPVGKNGDSLDRFLVRISEIEQSMEIVEQGFDMLNAGPVAVSDYKIVMPPKEDVYNSIEGMIKQFEIISGGVRPPKGEVYFPVEGGSGELGFYVVSNGAADGTAMPYRVHVRAPSFVNMGILARMVEGYSVADVVPMVGTMNIISSECDR